MIKKYMLMIKLEEEGILSELEWEKREEYVNVIKVRILLYEAKTRVKIGFIESWSCFSSARSIEIFLKREYLVYKEQIQNAILSVFSKERGQIRVPPMKMH